MNLLSPSPPPLQKQILRLWQQQRNNWLSVLQAQTQKNAEWAQTVVWKLQKQSGPRRMGHWIRSKLSWVLQQLVGEVLYRSRVWRRKLTYLETDSTNTTIFHPLHALKLIKAMLMNFNKTIIIYGSKNFVSSLCVQWNFTSILFLREYTILYATCVESICLFSNIKIIVFFSLL